MEHVLAQVTLPGGGTIVSPLKPEFATLPGVLNKAIFLIFGFSGFILLLMIIRAGFTLLTSAGDAKKTEQGKNQLTYAIVGFIVVFLAYWVVQAAGMITGLSTIRSMFP
jgi:hypothetical protein